MVLNNFSVLITLCYIKLHILIFFLSGITCLFIAAKVEEIYPPKIQEFAFVTDGACSDIEILDMEQLCHFVFQQCYAESKRAKIYLYRAPN